MIFIVVKFETKPEWAELWSDFVADFTVATRGEAGNLWFDWYRSLEHHAEYVLVEGFCDVDAGDAHVNSAHFRQFITDVSQLLVSPPKVIGQTIDAQGWSELGETSAGDI